jgi:hypothetical protein
MGLEVEIVQVHQEPDDGGQVPLLQRPERWKVKWWWLFGWTCLTAAQFYCIRYANVHDDWRITADDDGGQLGVTAHFGPSRLCLNETCDEFPTDCVWKLTIDKNVTLMDCSAWNVASFFMVLASFVVSFYAVVWLCALFTAMCLPWKPATVREGADFEKGCTLWLVSCQFGLCLCGLAAMIAWLCGLSTSVLGRWQAGPGFTVICISWVVALLSSAGCMLVPL